MRELRIQKQKHILHLHLHRPDRGNALTPQIVRALTQEVRAAENDSGLRGIFFSGEGKHFCTGADLEWVAQAGPEGFHDFKDLYAALGESGKVLLGRAQGRVLGAGVGLCAAMDILACDEETRFALPELKWGLIPGVLTPLVLAKWGEARLRALVLSGREMPAREALTCAFVHHVGTKEENGAFLEESFQNLLTFEPEAVKVFKQSLRLCLGDRESHLHEMARLSTARQREPATQSRLQTFLSRRKTSPGS